MSKLVRFIYAAIIIWVIFPIPLFIINREFYELRGLWVLFCLPIAIVLFITSYIALFREKRKTQPLLAIVFVIVVSYVSINYLINWGGWIHFQINRSYYEAMLKRVLDAQSREERQKICGGRCWINSESPLEVCFHYAHGFLNWHDFVYDPTGSVTQKESHNYTYLIGSEHLDGDWYFSHFGD